MYYICQNNLNKIIMWEREEYLDKSFKITRDKTSTVFETGRESRRRIRAEKRKLNKVK